MAKRFAKTGNIVRASVERPLSILRNSTKDVVSLVARYEGNVVMTSSERFGNIIL